MWAGCHPRLNAVISCRHSSSRARTNENCPSRGWAPIKNGVTIGGSSSVSQRMMSKSNSRGSMGVSESTSRSTPAVTADTVLIPPRWSANRRLAVSRGAALSLVIVIPSRYIQFRRSASRFNSSSHTPRRESRSYRHASFRTLLSSQKHRAWCARARRRILVWECSVYTSARDFTHGVHFFNFSRIRARERA